MFTVRFATGRVPPDANLAYHQDHSNAMLRHDRTHPRTTQPPTRPIDGENDVTCLDPRSLQTLSLV